ncbi:MAG: ABC transporter permease [Alkalispirochaetaceae bacterium]
MFLLRLAMRNLLRHRRRTVITAAAVGVGLGIYIFLDAFLLGAELESRRNLVWYETSSARVYDEEYWEERQTHPLDRVIEEPGEVLSLLDRMEIPAAARTRFAGELVVFRDPYPEDGSARITAYAIDPRRDDQVFRLREGLTEGRYLEPGEEGVLIGAWLAEDLGAEVGYPLTLITRTRHGYYQTMDLQIVGIINTPNPVINRTGLFVPLETADLYLQMEGAVTEVNMQFRGAIVRGGGDYMERRAREVERRLASVAPETELLSWRELAADYLALAETKQSGSGVILFLVFVIAAVGVSNTMLMSVYERTRELGMMRALGMRDREIRIAFLLEAGGIGVAGALLGSTLGALLTAFIVHVGIDYGWILREMDVGYRLAGVIRGAWNPRAFLTASLLGVLLVMTISLVPIRRALRMEVTEALRS